MPDVIVLTLPPDPRYATVARIVVGGLAARLDLTYEALDDLQLAVESVLQESVAANGDVTLTVDAGERGISIVMGPFQATAVSTPAATVDGSLDLETVLAAVVDEVEREDRDGTRWFRLVKHVALVER